MALNNNEFNKVLWANIILWPIVLIALFTTRTSESNIDTERNETQTSEISEYVKNNFGLKGYTASWFNDIEDIQINQTNKSRYIEVITLLDRTEKTIAKNLCGAVSNYWNKRESDFSGIRVIGIGREVISYRYSLGGQCH